jgi:hypothetical protein
MVVALDKLELTDFIFVNKEALEDVEFMSIVLNPAYKPA